jgi:arylformamidase
VTALVLARHGETVWHAAHRYAGSSDVPLTPEGHRQAADLAAWAATAGLDAVWTSDLSRARETAAPSARATGLPVRVDPRLRELDFGDGEGLTHAEMAQRWPEAYAAFEADPAAHPLPGGEDPAAAVARARAAPDEAATAHPGGRVLVVCHGTLLRLLLCHVLGVPPREYRRLFPDVRSAALTEVRLADGSAALLSYNDVVAAPPARLVGLDHVVRAGMTTYPGLPGPEVTRHLTREASRAHYAPGTEFSLDRVSLLGNTGTYVDSPFHRYAGATDLAGLPLGSLADLPTVVVRLRGRDRTPVDPGTLRAQVGDAEVAGAAVLLDTGRDAHWGTPEYAEPGGPHLDGAGAQWLVDHGARLVGTDAANVDDTGDDARPAHSVLLGASVPVLEHLTGLDRLPDRGARLHAVPVRLADVGTFPVRAYAVVRDAEARGPLEAPG